MTTSTNDSRFPIVGRILRRRANVVLQADTEARCLRVSCADGWCFDQADANGQNGLHELVTDYMHGTQREAMPHAVKDLAAPIEPCEAFQRGNCEWCHSAEGK